MLRDLNGIKEPYPKYLIGMIGRIVKEIPKERRPELADEIAVRAGIMGCQNNTALKAALKHLKEDS